MAIVMRSYASMRKNTSMIMCNLAEHMFPAAQDKAQSMTRKMPKLTPARETCRVVGMLGIFLVAP